MTAATGHFTAAQLAAWHDVSRARVHQWMVGVKPRKMKGRGGLEYHWSVSELRLWLYRDLEEQANRLLFRNVSHLLATDPAPWEPAHPVSELARDAVDKARVRRSILAPILAAPDAETVEVSILVKRALLAFRQHDNRLAAGEWAVRIWIEDARRRDKSLARWDRLEIYLDEKPALKSASEIMDEQLASIDAGSLLALLSHIAAIGGPDEAGTCEVWHAVFVEHSIQSGVGSSPLGVKQKLLQILDEKLPGFVPSSASTRSMAWQRRYDKWKAGGCVAQALKDGRAGRAGRKPDNYVAPEEERAIQEIAGRMHRPNRVRALEEYAKLPTCREALREVITRRRKSRQNMPEFLMCAATPPHPRKKLEEFKARCGTFEVMPDHTRREVEAGDWWLFDDMSQNTPFWFEKIEPDEEEGSRHQVTVCRQSILAMDQKSGKWLGCELIGRARDSYRAEDILRFFYRLFSLYGLPRRGLVLELGTWVSKVISGGREETIPMAEEEKEKVMVGLRQLGIEIRHKFTPTGKACIESGFGNFQTQVEVQVRALNLGRKRGERPADEKKASRVAAGSVHPQAVGMLHIEELRKEVEAVIASLNSRVKEGKLQHGVPDEVWEQSLKAKPLPPLPLDKIHLFMPLQKEVCIRGGHAQVTFNGRVLRFINPEEFVHLGEKYRVRVHLDPTEPALGAWVFNMETSTQNRGRLKVGDFICHATCVEDAPLHAPPGYVDDNIRNKKVFQGAVRVAFCAGGIYGYGGKSASELRNGRGDVLRLERGASVGLHEAGSSLPAKPRRGGNARADDLAELAKAKRSARNAPPPAPEIDLAKLEERERQMKEELGIFD